MPANLRLTPIVRGKRFAPRIYCAACKAQAEWILTLERLERTYCEPCLMDALLDAINFAENTKPADEGALARDAA